MDARIDTSARAWTVVAAAFGAMFTVFGVAYSFGVFFDPMAREFGSGRAAAAAVFALTGFVYFSLGVVSGPVVDRVGPRRVLVVGAIAMSSGLLLTSRVHTLWAGYLTYGIGVGIGVACGHVPMVAVVGGWFERRRTFALGLAVAGIGTGTLVGGPLAGALISRYGWRTTYVIFGVASGILLLACAGAAAKPPVPAGGALRLSQSVRTPQFRTMYLAMVVMGMPLFHVLVFLAPFARSEGIGGGGAGLLIGIVGAASVVGRLGLGAIGGRFGSIRMFKVSFAIMALSYPIWLLGSSYAALVLFAVTMGVRYGGYIALSPAVAAELWGVAGLGGTVGALYTAAAVSALVGPPLVGAVIDASGSSYRGTIFGGFVLAVVAVLLLAPLRRPSTAPTRLP